jgi:hypothetical protein
LQTSWSREKFALNVHVQGDVSSSAEPHCKAAGFLAVISISMARASTPSFARLKVGDDDGSSFMSKSDALAAGIDAANRMVDDLLS